MKFATFIAAPLGEDTVAFVQWCREEFVRSIPRLTTPPVAGVFRITQPVSLDRLRAEFGVLETAEFPRYEVVLETWYSSTEDFRRGTRAAEEVLRRRGARYVSVRVTPMLEKDPRFTEAGAGGVRPGLTFITPVCWVPNIALKEARKQWSEHVPIALRVHQCLTKYERNWVDEVMSWSEGAVPMAGYGDFSVQSVDGLVSDYFQSDDLTREIFQDAGQFIAKYSFIYLGDAQALSTL